MPLTAEHEALAKSLGIDLSKIDWTKVGALIQLLIQIFLTQKAQASAALKAKGCPDAHCDLMHQAICNNLQAADCCVQCCCE